MRAIVIALVMLTGLPAPAQDGAATRLGNPAVVEQLLVPQGQQQPTKQEPERNGSAQQAPGPDSNSPRNGMTVVDPREAPHQSGSPKQRAENGEGKNPDHGATGPSWQRFVEKLFEDPVAFFTVWVAVFTAALAMSTIGLWRQTRRLAEQAVTASEDTQKSLRLSALLLKQTARASRAAQQSANIADKTLFVTQRPIIVLAEVDFEGNTNNGWIRFVAKIVNTGPTVAVSVAFDCRLQITEADKNICIFDEKVPPNAGRTILGPSVPAFGRTQNISVAEIVDATQGKINIFVFVLVDYKDTILNKERRFQTVLRVAPMRDITKLKPGDATKDYFRFSVVGEQNIMT